MGDTPDDIRAAVAAGGNAIGVLTPQEQAKVEKNEKNEENQTTNPHLLLIIFGCLRLFVSCFGRLPYCPVLPFLTIIIYCNGITCKLQVWLSGTDESVMYQVLLDSGASQVIKPG